MSNVDAVIVPKGNSLVVLARIAGIGGTDIIQSSINTLTWKLVNRDDGTEVVSQTTLTKSTHIFNSLQTFTYPSGRTFRYNFKHVISGTNLSVGGVKYLAVYTFTDTESYPYLLPIDIDTEVLP